MIELRGIILFYQGGHSFIDLVVLVGGTHKYERHNMGIDVKPNKGKIITFLSGVFDVPPGEIVWPDHIELKTGGD